VAVIKRRVTRLPLHGFLFLSVQFEIGSAIEKEMGCLQKYGRGGTWIENFSDKRFLAYGYCVVRRQPPGSVTTPVPAYARIRNNDASERKFAEIRLRAIRKIGELSRELDKAQPGGSGGSSKVSSSGSSKREQLREAGISKSTAHRYEESAGPREQQAQQRPMPRPIFTLSSSRKNKNRSR
jgi:hypothetical protein